MAAPAQTAVLFKELRFTLHSILKELISKPQVLYPDFAGIKVVMIVVSVCLSIRN
ncbi:UNVERIFIED_CONTAM: DExH-box ATP-dependent RNA helicase DExH7, chloroplastic [Sesamum angustifolium]|uniref:DExH-box ATP-dependent RNA helicase DExH7, chloroplastic n=1 Tax=Sesamum angustifolium TaxID=2727405 RepID=A0AAW2QB65_9LAMI